ncbi:hypothetical protein Vafri_5280, partial [Volvox africanus]
MALQLVGELAAELTHGYGDETVRNESEPPSLSQFKKEEGKGMEVPLLSLPQRSSVSQPREQVGQLVSWDSWSVGTVGQLGQLVSWDNAPAISETQPHTPQPTLHKETMFHYTS